MTAKKRQTKAEREAAASRRGDQGGHCSRDRGEQGP
jgi:hypothetical protein